MTLASVVIPAHNRGKHIQRAIRSVLEQTYGHVDLVVVDDGSKDDTAEIVRGECARDPRVRLIEHGRQRGAQAARNTGIRAAQGEWIAFLDSDDYWLPESLEARGELLKARGKAVIYSDCYIHRPGRAEAEVWGICSVEGRVYKRLLQSPGPMFQSLLAPREAFLRINFLDERIVSYQEWETCVRLAKYYDFVYLPKPTFVYDCRHAGTISENRLREAVGYAQVFEKHWWPILWHVGPQCLSDHCQRAAEFYAKANSRAKARYYRLAALAAWPLRYDNPLRDAMPRPFKQSLRAGPLRAWKWLRRWLPTSTPT
jgi:glycosyltransferase involved in cell wall biosynthesis